VALMRVNFDPSRRELRAFSAVLVVVFGVLALLVLTRPGVLLIGAIVTAGGFLVSIAFNGDFSRRRQLLGAVFPCLLLAGFAAGRNGTLAVPAAAALGCLGVAGAAVPWRSERGGRTLYVGWMSAGVPVGWTVSQVCLALAYYVVLTPIGLLMRALGRDPMQRSLDRSAKSYWVEAPRPDSLERHFRQF
jgi:hypothetical protein